MKINQVKYVYLIGIGGIGMSALARFFKLKGCTVSGYDRTETALTNQLISEGIPVHHTDNPELIPPEIQQRNSQETLIIYTPAIPSTHQELNWLKNKGFTVAKRSTVLGWITTNYTTLAVAGTHGKTTTSSILAHILHTSGHGCNAFLGGITANFNSNLLYSENSNLMVVEADEYDRSFLALSPVIAVVTSMDADHLDIYGDADELVQTYTEFINRIRDNGLVLLHEDLPDIDTDRTIYRYGLEESNDFRYTQANCHGGEWTFDIYGEGLHIKGIKFQLPGDHNQQNATAAAAIAHHVGVDASAIKHGLETFKGVHRRFEYHINTPELVYIDDYAHHPSEIKATISAARERHPNRKITGIFQPHLFSRTRDFADEFAESLEKLDSIILLDIYPAREEPIPGVDSQWLMDKINSRHKKHIPYSRLLLELAQEDIDVLLTLGGGDIDKLVQPIKTMLLKRLPTTIN